MEYVAVIPARLGSRRFPGKLLALLGSEPVIVHTLSRVCQSSLPTRVMLATDNNAIASVVQEHYRLASRCEVVHTPSELACGTARVAWAVQATLSPKELTRSIVVNVQGDQPNLDPGHVDLVARIVERAPQDVRVATLGTAIQSLEELQDPSVVKCVRDVQGRALYFSRAAIPYRKQECDHGRQSPVHIARHDPTVSRSLRHLGLYAFRGDVLVNQIMNMPKGELEEIEDLEQLQWLYHRFQIQVGAVTRASRSIDVPSDIPLAIKELQGFADQPYIAVPSSIASKVQGRKLEEQELAI